MTAKKAKYYTEVAKGVYEQRHFETSIDQVVDDTTGESLDSKLKRVDRAVENVASSTANEFSNRFKDVKLNSGVEVQRSGASNAKLVFDESDDKWKMDKGDGNLEGVASEEELGSINRSISHFHSVTDLFGITTDGTEDITPFIRDYAAGKDEVFLYFPPGKYKWASYTKLTNKKIKLTGDHAVIEMYHNTTNLDIGDVTTKNTQEFIVQGIDFVNKAPKTGSGTSGVVIGDCVLTRLRDVNFYDFEQYAIQLRRQNGTLQHVLLENVNVYRNSGALATTTSIALETRASSGDGKIGLIKLSNCYFEVIDIYVNQSGQTVEMGNNSSNACKLQACDEIEMVNTTFVGGKENGPLTFAYDVKKVKMTNVTLRTNSLISKGLTISFCPGMELNAVNCELGVDNFSQSIGINGTVKEVSLTNCKLQRISVVSGEPGNFIFDNCNFYLPSQALQITLKDSKFLNCRIGQESVNKNIVVTGSNNTFVNFTGIGSLEISGSNNIVTNCEMKQLRANGLSSDVEINNCRITSDERPFRVLANTIKNWTLKNCVLVKVGTDTFPFATIQGENIKIKNCDLKQVNKETSLGSVFTLLDAAIAHIIESDNTYDVASVSNKYSVAATATLTRYKTGDTVVEDGVIKIWDGTQFVALTTA